MKKNERLDALKILLHVIQDKTPLSHLLSPDTSSLTKELCFGVCRHYVTLTHIADQLAKKRPKEHDVWILLLMGLYQLHALRIPEYAVVQETVALTHQLKKTWAKGFINALLRSYCRQQDTFASLTHDNHPAWFQQRLQHDWPHDWPQILHANDARPPMTLRVNTARVSTLNYLQILHQAGFEAHLHPHAPEAIILQKPCSVHDLPGFSAGDISVQDAAAQLAVALLQLKPGLRVLDACCAPGGKTCHILEKQPDVNLCLGLDLDAKRLERTRENAQRLHLHPTLKQGNGLDPAAWWDGELFDRILLDAPCSATGVIRRHPDIKLLRTAQDIHDIAMTQHALLNTLWPLLKKDGLMVYATCSVMMEENEQQIKRFVDDHSDATPIKTPQSWGHQTLHGQQILPGEDDMDGFFYSILRKK